MTPNFRAAEFDQLARHSLPAAPYPKEWFETRLRPLCEALEAIRAEAGPLRVLSGYRSEAYNKKINGARSSQHVQGRAADIVAVSKAWPPRKLHDLILSLRGRGLIKIGGLGLYPGFVHVDVRPGERLARWSGSRKDTA